VKIRGGTGEARRPVPERPRAEVRFLERGSQLPHTSYGIWEAL